MMRSVFVMCLVVGWFFYIPQPAVSETQKTAIPDHIEALAGPFPDGISVTGACLECHEDQGEEMLASAHWRWKGPTPYLVGHENEKELGKNNLINNY